MRLPHGDEMIATKTFSFKSIANYNAYTKLLIHSNTTDGSTTFTDSSDSAHSHILPGDNAQHDTAQTNLEQSAYCLMAIRLFLSRQCDFNFGDDDFTIDFWARFSEHSHRTRTILAQYTP